MLIYLHYLSLQPFSQDYELAYVVRINFIHKWHDLQFKLDSDRQISEKEIAQRNFFHISFYSGGLAYDLKRGLTPNMSTLSTILWRLLAYSVIKSQ